MDEFEKNLNHLLVDTFNYILKYEETSLKSWLNVPVTITEAHMLEAIVAQGDEGITVSKIAALLNIALPTATVAVKKLESKGFISKVPCEKDGRRAIVKPTNMGKKLIKPIGFFMKKWFEISADSLLNLKKKYC